MDHKIFTRIVPLFEIYLFARVFIVDSENFMYTVFANVSIWHRFILWNFIWNSCRPSRVMPIESLDGIHKNFVIQLWHFWNTDSDSPKSAMKACTVIRGTSCIEKVFFLRNFQLEKTPWSVWWDIQSAKQVTRMVFFSSQKSLFDLFCQFRVIQQ